jgi:hypothetical protein
MLLAVPSVVVDGQVLQGPKLLAWFNEVTSTYLEPAYWTSSYSFSATKSLFSDAPELLATWRQTTQSDTKVRKKAKAPQHLLQHGDKTVAKIATAHLEDVHLQVRQPQLGEGGAAGASAVQQCHRPS